MTDTAQKIAERVPLPAPYRHGGTYESAPFDYYTTDQMEALRLAVAEEALRGDSPAATVEEISFDGVALLQWHIEPAPGMALFVAPQKALRGAEAVATVESWTNGSYHRNYKITWHKDVPEGAKLYTAPPAPAVDEAMVGRTAIAIYRAVTGSSLPMTAHAFDLYRQHARAALTAALHGDKA